MNLVTGGRVNKISRLINVFPARDQQRALIGLRS